MSTSARPATRHTHARDCSQAGLSEYLGEWWHTITQLPRLELCRCWICAVFMRVAPQIVQSGTSSQQRGARAVFAHITRLRQHVSAYVLVATQRMTSVLHGREANENNQHGAPRRPGVTASESAASVAFFHKKRRRIAPPPAPGLLPARTRTSPPVASPAVPPGRSRRRSAGRRRHWCPSARSGNGSRPCRTPPHWSTSCTECCSRSRSWRD